MDVVPDLATIALGVMTRGSTAAAAVAANYTNMQAVVAALRGAGIPDARIRTANFYVGPIYNSPQDSAQPPAIAGFESSNMVEVQLVDVTAAGHIIDIALSNGANQIQGVGFSLRTNHYR